MARRQSVTASPMPRDDRQLVGQLIELYNSANSTRYQVQCWPEDDSQSGFPPVDVIANDATRIMAVEHTLAQPFVGEREDSSIFRYVIAPLENDDALRFAGHDVTLTTKVGAIPKGVDWEELRLAVRNWLTHSIQILPEGVSRYVVQGLELEITKTLDDYPGFSGSVFVFRQTPEDDTLECVLETALTNKLPKLAATRADLKILLLESSTGLIYSTVEARLKTELAKLMPKIQSDLMPDEIWLVNTVGWKRYGSLRFRRLWPDLGSPHARRHSCLFGTTMTAKNIELHATL